ncbi:GGDEF domain-containing protein [Cryptosporangium sp. NPDC048952]|uniref:GGDEF domain-containing protein n=1 Tax=Cryptosporangium sp. NPDC048952 TaxID=3363961 RepID=UPI003715F9D7
MVSLAIRLVPLLLAVAAAVGGPGAPPVMYPQYQSLTAAAPTLLIAASVVGVVALRRRRARVYSLLSATQVGLDVAAVLAGTEWSPFGTLNDGWPMLAIPVLLGAARFQLMGALSAWSLVTVGVAVGESVHPSPVAPNHVQLAVFACVTALLLGLAFGGQTRAYTRQLQQTEEAQAALAYEASHDSLTGLANRGALYAHAAEVLGSPGLVAVLVLDLNDFKLVNDVHGHAAGDEVLRRVAEVLETATPSGMLAARVGGDEFVVVLTGHAAADPAAVVGRIEEALRTPVIFGGVELHVRASIGTVVRAAHADTTLDALLATADAAMYRDKAHRRRTDRPGVGVPAREGV